MICVACKTGNDPAATVCSSCRRPLEATTATVGATVIAERYEVIGHLGRGGMGEVFRARDRMLDEIVALKVLRATDESSELAQRFRSEIKLARKVTHPNVCRIHDYGETSALRYISMELVNGTDLKKLVRSAGPLPAERVFDLVIQMANGLEAIHNVGIVHRDLKSPNVMVDADGVVKLMDFGIAKLDGHQTSGVTDTGHLIGTPDYMSPEQATGARVDLRADLYALGVITFELFTGRLPFRAETPLATLLKQIHEPPPFEAPYASLIPASAVPLLRRALEKNPANRFPSARAMAEAARQAASSDGPVSVAGTVAHTLPLSETRVAAPAQVARAGKWRMWGVGPAVLVAVVLVGVLGPWPLRQRVPPATDGSRRAAPQLVRVRINALPWARITVTPHQQAPVELTRRQSVTPTSIALPEGTYTIDFENGGITPPTSRQVRLSAATPDVLAVMPGWDVDAAVRRSAP